MSVRAGFATAADKALLSYRVDGEGGTTLIACNGIGVSTFFWRPLAAHFARLGHTFVTWDYRGHGQSPVPRRPQDVTVAECARDLWAVLDALHVQKAVLLGHSMGAQVILEAYRQRAGRVQALVPVLGAPGRIFDSVPLGRRIGPLFRLLVELGESNARLFELALRRALRFPYVWQLLKSLRIVHPDLCPREDFEPYFEHLRGLDLRAYFALARDLFTHDASDLLARVAVPTLVIAGEHDLFTPERRSRELAQAIPGAELLVLREGSHAALIEQPELVAQTLEKFLRRAGLC